LIYILLLIIWLYLHSRFSGRLRKTIIFYMSALRPFKVIQGHWFWYQSKARKQFPISPIQ